MEGRIGESMIQAAGLGETKHLRSAGVASGLFILAKKIIAIGLEDVRWLNKAEAAVARDNGSSADFGFDIATRGELGNGSSTDNQDVAKSSSAPLFSHALVGTRELVEFSSDL
jgi:hypothetical protein